MVNTLLDKDGRPLYEGISPEVSGTYNEPGVYELPDGKQVITAAGSSGVPQADALIRLGFKRVAPVPSPQEIRDMQAAQLAKTKAEEPETKLSLSQLPDLLKRLDAAESELRELRSKPAAAEPENETPKEEMPADAERSDESKKTKK